MSPGSNGTSSGSVSAGPIPAETMLHAVLLLPESENRLAQYLDTLPLRTLGLGSLEMGEWIAIDQPRPCSWTDFSVGEWRFRLVFDPQGLPPSLVSTVTAGRSGSECDEAIEEHKACCLVFLLTSPSEATPWNRFVALCKVAWGWVDAGASLLSLPEARLLLPRRVLLGIEPDDLSPEHGYLFVSNGLVEIEEKKGERTLWLRTWGLGQFSLPDLAVGLPSREGEEAGLEADLASLRLLFETLPPAMIREHGILPVGGTIEVGSRTWTAIGEPGNVDYPFLRSRCGIQLFV